ncbi:hypothetical protein BDB00DRAFT_823954 [Zychaea mexicana]|uniref:uncharacterized protein n=1 Tax=Zychaea mexicana TaxID=64656 RepID=UPI0022FE111B|nr:uncharacterized protein BDB00DRAFT_823954 [Zychaea mexicana]KAI9493214.1 hypothetical protein BDB00DRAFT_823954 [Zychaea mexicana]
MRYCLHCFLTAYIERHPTINLGQAGPSEGQNVLRDERVPLPDGMQIANIRQVVEQLPEAVRDMNPLETNQNMLMDEGRQASPPPQPQPMEPAFLPHFPFSQPQPIPVEDGHVFVPWPVGEVPENEEGHGLDIVPVGGIRLHHGRERQGLYGVADVVSRHRRPNFERQFGRQTRHYREAFLQEAQKARQELESSDNVAEVEPAMALVNVLPSADDQEKLGLNHEEPVGPVEAEQAVQLAQDADVVYNLENTVRNVNGQL